MSLVPAWPPQMVADIAHGMEEPVDVAWRYGYAASEYRALEQNPAFVAAVASARSELEKGGHTARVKARWMTEQLMDEVYIRAKNAASPLPQLLDAVKTLAKIGDLEPKQEKVQQATGPGTSVQIIFSGAPGDKPEVRIGPAEEEAPLVFEIPMEEKKDDPA
jgi:hypothetical protein